jgi:hypothetical protein
METCAMKTYSVILNWQDNDPQQGTFGATVRASSTKEAEAKAAQMRDCDEHRDDDDADDGEVGGSVVELSEGAHWLSCEMEEALRELINGDPRKATEAARAIIAQIDAI